MTEMLLSAAAAAPSRTSRDLLPGGYVDADGRVHREVEVVAMTGRDEERLADPAAVGSATLITELLARLVRRIGAITPVTAEVARALLVADRQFLLLKVREATFGSQVRWTVECPWADCGRRIDVAFDIGSIPVEESTAKGPWHTIVLDPADALVDGEHTHRELSFRLPDGGDQEALAGQLDRNEAAALRLLLQRCIVRIGPFAPPPAELVQRLSPAARRAVEQRMARLAPRVDLTMESTCPECGRSYSVPFEIQGFLFGELRVDERLLRQEIHYLAAHYHWSEREIMEMPRSRRRRYVAHLAEEIERSRDDS